MSSLDDRSERRHRALWLLAERHWPELSTPTKAATLDTLEARGVDRPRMIACLEELGALAIHSDTDRIGWELLNRWAGELRAAEAVSGGPYDAETNQLEVNG